MTWVEVTVPQLEAARQWWESRTPEEREAQWPKRVYRNAAALFPCRWGVFSGCEAAYHAMTLMDAGMICEVSQGRPEDAVLAPNNSRMTITQQRLLKHDLTGKTFGKFTVLSLASIKLHKFTWLCRCECGTKKEIRGSHLRSGHISSCGCNGPYRPITHGQTGTREHASWKSMKARCLNPQAKGFENYGGRGISICDRWLNSFENFLADMGPRPKGTSIERIDNNRGYEPNNCRWATPKEQAANRRPYGTNLLSGSGRDDKAIPLRRVPRLTESGNGLYVRVGGRK